MRTLFRAPRSWSGRTQKKSFIKTAEQALAHASFVERALFSFFALLLVITSIILVGKANAALLVEVPAHGGSFTEGVIGSPRFINPLLATSDADRDLTQLIYSGLFAPTAEGRLVPDLASDYTISNDGLMYTVTLRDDITFHDGTAVTVDDILYTIESAQNPDLKSPKRADWEGVTLEKIDEQTILFTLPRPYQPFLENLTLGILPKHLWENTPIEQIPFSPHNIEPIGSGPYKIESIKRDSDGVPTRYTVTAFNTYARGKPFIDTITLRFYPNQEELVNALRQDAVDSAYSLSPQQAREFEQRGEQILQTPLPRIFGVFFNQNRASVFTHPEVRFSLDEALDKKTIINEVLLGFGSEGTGPLPSRPQVHNENQTHEERIESARARLERNGWELNEDGVYQKTTDDETTLLSFSLATANTPELKQTAELLQESWDMLGAKVQLELFDVGNLNNDVIRPREYDALFFGQIVGRDKDVFPFWHSSQRNDPGLNIALYANITVDEILESLRTTFNEDELASLYERFEEEIANDLPALFVYTPDFIYLLDEDIKAVDIGAVTTASERFANVHTWHIQTDRVWPLFVKSKENSRE